jgi:arginyl-tRNA synthetase
MNCIDQLKNRFLHFLTKTFSLEAVDLSALSFSLNIDEQKQQFGDISSNVALVLAKKRGESPKSIAERIVTTFKDDALEKIEIAGPGFLNFYLNRTAYISLATDLFAQWQEFFSFPQVKKLTYSVEFVSANPTGPLHLGHGRGGIIGDVLSNILHLIGHQATKEYYINDAGSQIQKLGESFKIRCQQELGFQVQIPEDGYHGDYLKQLARECLETYGREVLSQPDSFFATYAKDRLLEHIRHTLLLYGIRFDVWFSEKSLHESNAVNNALEKLTQRNMTYEKDGALWFISTQFGDDKDRVLRKQNGELTYISSDVAYTENKFERADRVILVLGQDHHSYVVRLKGITAALGFNPDHLDVILYQLVTLKEAGELLRMSKRAGTMVSLQEIIETVGTDVARFFFLNRKADAHLDFDIDLALKKTEENPVYYIQYAYVRIKSIIQKAQEKEELTNILVNDAFALDQTEYLLIKKIISLKELLLAMSQNYQTHLLTYYVLELAQLFHVYYSKNRIIDMSTIPQSRARLLLAILLKNTFELSLDLLGLSKPEKM